MGDLLAAEVDDLRRFRALLDAPGILQLSIIEYTERQTTLGTLGMGSRVHVEADVIAKHVQRLFAAQRAALT